MYSLIDAVYVNTAGGAVLLNHLIKNTAHLPNLRYLLDERFVPEAEVRKAAVVRPGEMSRLGFYKRNKHLLRSVLCFGNVPPPLRLECPVETYLHNRLILESSSIALMGFSAAGFLAKRMYIRFRSPNTDKFIVQTGSMAHLCSARLGVSLGKVSVKPVFQEGRYSHIRSLAPQRDRHKFGYVSYPYPYKRHRLLLDAWNILAQRQLYPELHLTVPAGHALAETCENSSKKGVKVINHGLCDPSGIYAACAYQIYPSDLESFGLGLVESAEAGCAVIGPRHAYVSDVIEPFASWDEDNPGAVADVVERCMSQTPKPSKVVIRDHTADLIDFLSR